MSLAMTLTNAIHIFLKNYSKYFKGSHIKALKVKLKLKEIYSNIKIIGWYVIFFKYSILLDSLITFVILVTHR